MKKKTLKNLLLTLGLFSETLVAGWAQQVVAYQKEVYPYIKIQCVSPFSRDTILEDYNKSTNPEFREKLQDVLEKNLGWYWSRPVTSSLMLGIGGATVHDTYLTNQLYEGKSVDLSYQRNRWRRSFKWDSDQWLDLSMANSKDVSSESNSMFSVRLRYHYAMHRRWCLNYGGSKSSTIFVGPYAMMNFGANYNLSMGSGNNPVNVHYTNNYGISAGYQWNYAIRHRLTNVRLQVQVPVFGMAFAPEYAASYYETFMLDKKSELSYTTSLHNQQDLDVRLTTDIPVSIVPRLGRFGTSLRLGVQYHIETQKINGLIARYSYFQGVIGWTWQYLPYKASSR